MKILQSAVQLTGTYRDTVTASRITDASVHTSNQPASGGVQLTLTSNTREQQTVRSSSQISSASDYRYLSASASLQYITESVLHQQVSLSSMFMGVEESPQGVMMEIRHVSETERESRLTLEALGSVRTEDGRTIDFMLALDFNRYSREQQSSLFSGKVTLIDPLIINLQGGAVQLSDQTFAFDLDSDGQTEQIARTASGSGYLVFDRNGNGQIDDGREMFGPHSGNGFAELAQYDEDGNGWIDSNDSIFQQLGILQFNGDQPELLSAADAGLGALYLGSTDSDYALLRSDGSLQGSIRRSGVALSAEGAALLMQEVHLSVDGKTLPTPQALQPLILTSVSPLQQMGGLRVSVIAEIDRNRLRDWVSQSMEGFQPLSRHLAGTPVLYQPATPAAARSPLSLRDDVSTDLQDPDGRLQMLRATIDSLRAMRRQMDGTPLHQYRHVGHLNG